MRERPDCRANPREANRAWGKLGARYAAFIQKFNLMLPRSPISTLPIQESSQNPASPVFTARLEPDGTLFDAPASLPLLQAAELAGLTLLANSCRNGSCRSCICRLVSGQVTYRIEWPGLSLEEKREGYILPCVAHPASDVVIRLSF